MSISLTKKVEELSAIIYFMNFFKSHLIYFQSSVSEIVMMFTQEQMSSKLSFLKECAILCRTYDFPEAWKEALNKKDIYASEVKPILLDFANKIGTSDIESQIKYVDYYISETDKCLKKAEIKEADNKKLYIILGLTVGLLSAIMII